MCAWESGIVLGACWEEGHWLCSRGCGCQDGAVTTPDDGVEVQAQHASENHFQAAPRLQQSQLESMQHVGLYLSAPVPTLFSFKSFYLCPLANIYLDAVLCSIHTYAMCSF